MSQANIGNNMETTLYKTTKGTTRVWSIICEENNLYISHGTLNGLMQKDQLEYHTYEEAKEAQRSKIAEKTARQGYSYDINSDPPGLPMLLQNFREHQNKMPNRIYYQPKIDGFRCIASKDFMLTRRNDLITAVPHIQQALGSLPRGIVLDGELACEGWSLQEVSTVVRKHKPPYDHKKIVFNVFDVQTKGTYSERLAILDGLHEDLFNTTEYVQQVPTQLGMRHKADTYLEQMLAAGYEGVVLRNPRGLYCKDYRSYDVQKYKPIYTKHYKVIDLVAADKGREKDAAIVVCQEGDNLFKARIAETISTRIWMYKNKEAFIGGTATIEFSDWTDSHIPQHPRCVSLET